MKLLENFFYKSIYIPVKCSKSDYKYLMKLNKLSAEIWNECVMFDKEITTSSGKFATDKELQTFVKTIENGLLSSSKQYIQRKYSFARKAMISSIKAKHENSSKVKLPYKEKKYMNTGWSYQVINCDYDKRIIKLSKSNNKNGTRNKPIKCYAKTIPKNIVEIELIYKNKLFLCIKYKELKTTKNIESNNVASIDLGEIHSITSIDNNGNAIIITGRKMRSIKRLRNKEMSKLRSKMSRCTKYSRQWNKYNKALYKLKYKTDNQIKYCVHKISKLYLDYCIENNISKVYYGKLDSCTRNTKKRTGRFIGQKLNEWNYGELTRQLHNKLERYGIKLEEINEAYTSKTCPNCGKRNKPNGRNYYCKCGYIQHRDIVGAINILNFNEENKIKYYTSKKYLRIV